MALYSVWDWDRNVYRVYRDDVPVSVGDDPKPPKPSKVGPIGADPDTQIKSLPSGAKFLGYDQMAHGEIRIVPRLPLGLDDPGESSTLKYILAFAAGGAAVWFLTRDE